MPDVVLAQHPFVQVERSPSDTWLVPLTSLFTLLSLPLTASFAERSFSSPLYHHLPLHAANSFASPSLAAPGSTQPTVEDVAEESEDENEQSAAALLANVRPTE